MPAPDAGLERLHWRLSSFYFFYYATVGAFMPYWAPYLQARGFSALQMGIAFALMGVTRSILPVLWGWYADHTGRRIALIRWASVAALLTFMAIPFVDGVWWIGGLMIAYTLFWHALLPQFEVVTLNHLQVSGGEYSRVRLWGSVGFVASVLGLGMALDLSGILWLPWLVGSFWLGMAATSWLVPEPPSLQHPGAAKVGLWSVVKRPEVLALLAVCLASQLSFAPYYNFFTLFLERHHYSRSLAGLLWALGVVAEIGMFLVISGMIARWGARRMMILALAATSLRWGFTAFAVESWAVLIGVQLAHAITFGAYHAVAMHYVMRLFPASLHGRGQAIYNAVAYGIGGSVGSLSAGYLWQDLSPEATFYAAAVVAAIGTAIAWRYLPEPER
jgi:PPP family 3-phenylpropionic acid transporter